MAAKYKLTPEEITQIARDSSISPRSFATVMDIESKGQGFLPSGKPKILFEAHVFSRLTGHKYDKSNPNISAPKWDKSLYKGGEGEWTRLNEAKKLNPSAALKSASWGMGQVLGENYADMGYSSVEAMVSDFSKGEKEQAEGMAKFIVHNKLVDAVNNQDWATFAKRYNGPGYADNKYDILLKASYAKMTNFLSDHKVAAAGGGIVVVVIIIAAILIIFNNKKA